jgi:hypothetical protein
VQVGDEPFLLLGRLPKGGRQFAELAERLPNLRRRGPSVLGGRAKDFLRHASLPGEFARYSLGVPSVFGCASVGLPGLAAGLRHASIHFGPVAEHLVRLPEFLRVPAENLGFLSSRFGRIGPAASLWAISRVRHGQSWTPDCRYDG